MAAPEVRRGDPNLRNLWSPNQAGKRASLTAKSARERSHNLGARVSTNLEEAAPAHKTSSEKSPFSAQARQPSTATMAQQGSTHSPTIRATATTPRWNPSSDRNAQANSAKNSKNRSKPDPNERDRLERKLRMREPRAVPSHGARAATPKKNPVVCTNNKNDPRLRENGGGQELGTHSQCIRRGFGAGLHSKPENMEEFLNKHRAPYEKLIEQKLWFKDSTENMPPDYQIATLPQAFQKGFGAGQAKLAKQMLEKRNHALRV